MKRRILTHDGMFHADEVFAIALIVYVYGNNIVIDRNRDPISEDDYNNPSLLILDRGMRYEPYNGNFDHHQDVELEATNVLVLEYLKSIEAINEAFYEELRKDFYAISLIDRNGAAEGDVNFNVNSLIKSFNYITGGFDKAVRVATDYITARYMSVLNEEMSRKIYDEGVSLHDGNVKVCRDFPTHWKRYKEASLLIVPTKPGVFDGEWTLHTASSTTLPLKRTGKETYMHTGAFIAVYANLDDAILGSLKTLSTTKKKEKRGKVALEATAALIISKFK